MSPQKDPTSPNERARQGMDLALMLSSLGDALVFYALTPEGRFIYASHGAAALFGADSEDLIGRPFAQTAPLDEMDAEYLAAARARIKAEGGEIVLTCRFRPAAPSIENSRSYLLREWSSSLNGPGTLIGFLLDLSQCEPAESALASKALLYQTMLDHAPVGLIHLDEQGVATDCNERFASALGAKREDYVGFDAPNKLKNEHVRNGVLKALHGEFAVYEGEYASVVGDRSSYFRMIFTPVTPGHSPSEAIVMFEDVSETRRAQEELRESEKRHRIVFENAPLAMVHFNGEGTIINCNDAFVELMGSSREALIGFNVPERAVNDTLRHAVLAAISGEKTSFEGEYASVTGGKTTNLRVILNPVAPGAPKTEAIATFEEITERYRHEKLIAKYSEALEDMVRERTAELTLANERLRENEEKLRQIVEHSGDMFYSHTPDGVLTYVSPRTREYLDCEPEEAMTRWTEFAPDTPHNRAAYELTAKALESGRRQPPYEMELLTRAGRTLWVEVRESPVVKDGEVVAMVGALSDVSERKKARDDLRRSESNLALAQKMAHFGSWTYDATTNRFRLSKEMARIHGIEADSLGKEDYLGRVHPEDADFVANSLMKLFGGGPAAEIEYRIIRPDGETRVLRAIAEITARDAEGVPMEAAGTAHDITERRLAEDQFELARRIFDNAVEGVVVTDATGAIQFVNKGFTQITGYQAAEVLGQNPRILKSDRHGEDFYMAMWQNIRETGSWEGEIWNRRKSGEAYPEWLSITAIPDAQGRPSRYVSVFHDVSELWKRDQELRHQASHDGLTGLPNRSLFLDRLRVAIAHSRRENHKIVVALLDLDKFQTINDALGHPAGDRLLQELAGRLSIPASWEGTLARPGGDEFLFFLENADDDDIPRLTNWFFSSLEPSFSLEGRDIFITASLGLAVYPADGGTAEDLVKNADLALHQSKQFGRNTYSLYRPELNERIRRRLELENDLRQALERKEIVLHYQPQVDAATGRTVGMEALVRWKRGDRLVSPMDFIPLAEETGLIVPIGEFVLREACRKLAALRKAGHQSLRVAVNLSARQFREETLADMVASALAETGLPAHMLELEITESALVNNTPTALDAARRLNDMGVLLALDDFGTGYSSLSYLRMFPIKCLKIDKSFVDDIPDDPEANALVGAVIAMARSLGLIVVAEGVETDEQLWYLREQKCELIQGYRVSKPLPDGDIDAFLRDNPQFALFTN